MTIGFALGPLVAGVLAQWLPAPTVVPYVPHIVLMMAVLASLRAVPETLRSASRDATAAALPPESRRRFRRLVVPMAPWVFAAPAIAFALLPSIVGAGHAADGVSKTARDQAGSMLGLLALAVGLALGALAAAVHETWLLVPCSLVLGSAYGLCLVAGLLEVQRLAPERALGVLTAGYYAVTYTGFAAPYLMTLASGATSYAILLMIASGLAVVTAGVVRHGAQPERERRAQPVRGLIG